MERQDMRRDSMSSGPRLRTRELTSCRDAMSCPMFYSLWLESEGGAMEEALAAARRRRARAWLGRWWGRRGRWWEVGSPGSASQLNSSGWTASQKEASSSPSSTLPRPASSPARMRPSRSLVSERSEGRRTTADSRGAPGLLQPLLRLEGRRTGRGGEPGVRYAQGDAAVGEDGDGEEAEEVRQEPGHLPPVHAAQQLVVRIGEGLRRHGPRLQPFNLPCNPLDPEGRRLGPTGEGEGVVGRAEGEGEGGQAPGAHRLLQLGQAGRGGRREAPPTPPHAYLGTEFSLRRFLLVIYYLGQFEVNRMFEQLLKRRCKMCSS